MKAVSVGGKTTYIVINKSVYLIPPMLSRDYVTLDDICWRRDKHAAKRARVL